jgi:hypothetical protein
MNSMKKHLFKNTKQNGSVRTIIFKEGRTWYGVALEFNIVESGDNPKEVALSLNEAITGYIESVDKSGLSNSVLNQKTDPEYEKLWKETTAPKKQSGHTYQSIYSANLLSFPSLVC